MDLLDILFYIVIGIISIFSYSSQKNAKRKAEEIELRKRKPVQDVNQEKPYVNDVEAEESGETFAEEYVRKLYDFYKVREALSETVEKLSLSQDKESDNKYRSSVETSVKVPMLLFEEGQSVIKKDSLENSSTINDNEEKSNLAEIDWRRAVIASEILNRKY